MAVSQDNIYLSYNSVLLTQAQSPRSPAALGIASQESLRLRWRNWLFLLGQHLLCVLKRLFKTTLLVCQDCSPFCPPVHLERFYVQHSIQTNKDYDCTHLSGIKILKNSGTWTKLHRPHSTFLAVQWSATSNYYSVLSKVQTVPSVSPQGTTAALWGSLSRAGIPHLIRPKILCSSCELHRSLEAKAPSPSGKHSVSLPQAPAAECSARFSQAQRFASRRHLLESRCLKTCAQLNHLP